MSSSTIWTNTPRPANLASAPGHEPTGVSRLVIQTFVTKARSALLPALIVLLAVFAREAITSRLRVKGLMLPILMSSLSLIAFLCGFVLDIIEGVAGIEEAALVGWQVDLVTPAILTGLDLYREVANALMLLLESWIVTFMTALAGAIRWVNVRVRRLPR